MIVLWCDSNLMIRQAALSEREPKQMPSSMDVKLSCKARNSLTQIAKKPKDLSWQCFQNMWTHRIEAETKWPPFRKTTLANAFLWMKMLEFRLKFHWSLFIRVQLTIFLQWFRWWLGAVQATNHYLNQWWWDYRRIYASLGLNELIHSR